MIRLLLVDDHEIVTDGIRSLFEDESEIHIIGQCTNGRAALEMIKKMQPHVVITDIEMPEMNGIELTKQIKKKYKKEIAVIVLSMYSELFKIKEAIEAEVDSYILKNTGKQELMRAILTVHKGKPYYSSEISQIIIHGMNKKKKKDPANPFNKLTDREIQITKLIVKEYTNPEIAEEMCISEFTVKTHRRNLIKKLGVKGTIGLVRLALEFDLLGDEEGNKSRVEEIQK